MYWNIPRITPCTEKCVAPILMTMVTLVQLWCNVYIYFFFQSNSYRRTFNVYARIITSVKRAIFAPIIFQSIDRAIRHKKVSRYRQI